ncbi:MAG TPA: methyltransferase domain-containing protein [Candidatus Brocadiia bacterium]|nr:methyltransferase domain-containing protein [Candidatus Brocadiia bacterium]
MPCSSSAAPKAKSCRWPVVALFALALAPRLGLALWLPNDDTVFEDRPYREMATHLREGAGFWTSAPYGGVELERAYAFRPPLFPFLWGLAQWVIGGAFWPVRVAHAVLSAAALVAAWAVGRRLTGDSRAAWVGAAMAALYPPLIWHSVHLMTEPLFIFLLMLTLWALMRSGEGGGLKWAVWAGVFAGLGTLTRSALAGFLPLAGAWLCLARWRGKQGRPVAAALVFWGAAGAMLVPWTARNAAVFGRFVPSTTDFGHGFYAANNPRSLADPRGFYLPDSWAFLRASPAERLDDEVEISRRLTAATLRFIQKHPGQYARLVVDRLLKFWRPWPSRDFVPGWQVAVYAMSFIPAMALAAAGAVVAWRRRAGRGHALVALLILYMAGIHALVLVMLRYRVPLMPLLLMYAGLAVVAGWDGLAGRWRRAKPAGFDGVAEAYDSALPAHVQDHYLARRAGLLRQLKGAGLGLDVGCGTGRLLEAVGGRGVGVDLSAGMLGVMARHGRGAAARASAAALPFADETFDAVWSVAVLHHLAGPERVAAAVAEMWRVARPGGAVVIWDHNPLNPYWPVIMARAPQDSGAERLVAAAEVAAALRAAGAVSWRLRRMGWIPDFSPRWLMPVFVAAQWVLERVPLVSRLGAHNVFVAVKPGGGPRFRV